MKKNPPGAKVIQFCCCGCAEQQEM